MSLRSALERLPSDRETEAAIKRVLVCLRLHVGEWFDTRRMVACSGIDRELAVPILSALVDAFVLDFDDTQPGYRYVGDRLTEIEIERFLRAADCRSGHVQDNVRRFRERYGSR